VENTHSNAELWKWSENYLQCARQWLSKETPVKYLAFNKLSSRSYGDI
jgi:hypothetical protein